MRLSMLIRPITSMSLVHLQSLAVVFFMLAASLHPGFVTAQTPLPVQSLAQVKTDTNWPENLTPISRQDWNVEHAAHLLSRAGFGGTPEQASNLAKLSPKRAVRQLSRGRRGARALEDFTHSGVFNPGLDPFPSSRPATTNLAKTDGQALGILVKPEGNRPMQPVVNEFFYWLRASRLETDRIAYWWANRMLQTSAPLQEKMALFWHGHFATNEDKVRDYRKMLQQLNLLQQHGLSSFRELLVKVAQDPAMLAFLDAGVNVKDSPNENFAREVMELFTLGVGSYGESDVREAARAFTGWNYTDLKFQINPADQDTGSKTLLGKTGNFNGVEVLDLILAQPAAAEFIAGKLYRYFVREELSPRFQAELGQKLQALDYQVGDFLEMLFTSKDFYASISQGSRIKGPVELVISTYKKMGLTQVPGTPDFNLVTGGLGQRLLHPPTVAGWSHGRSWITPSLLFERGNFVLDLVFPDISFIPPDRYPSYGSEIVNVHKRLRSGLDISNATKPSGTSGEMAASNMLADADEAFNTRYGSYRGWQMAIERVLPIPRHTARLQLTEQVLAAKLTSPEQVVSNWVERYFLVAPSAQTQAQLAQALAETLGTTDLQAAASYLEEPLRNLLHLLLSLPEYQLG